MNERDLRDMLITLFQNLNDARAEVDNQDDEFVLADIVRDMVEEGEPITHAITFEDAQLLTRREGIVVRTAGGSEFQISIVESC